MTTLILMLVIIALSYVIYYLKADTMKGGGVVIFHAA